MDILMNPITIVPRRTFLQSVSDSKKEVLVLNKPTTTTTVDKDRRLYIRIDLPPAPNEHTFRLNFKDTCPEVIVMEYADSLIAPVFAGAEHVKQIGAIFPDNPNIIGDATDAMTQHASLITRAVKALQMWSGGPRKGSDFTSVKKLVALVGDNHFLTFGHTLGHNVYLEYLIELEMALREPF